jgi:hypothetical protein
MPRAVCWPAIAMLMALAPVAAALANDEMDMNDAARFGQIVVDQWELRDNGAARTRRRVGGRGLVWR